MKDRLYIIDISNFIHRAFHVHQDLSTSTGMPTGAVYGTLSMLCNFINIHKPTNLVICYDSQDGKSVRRDMYPLYKANRVQVNAVSAQELIVRRLVDLLGICSVQLSGYEADDLIASVTSKFKGDMEIVIVTGDKDMLQLIDKDVIVYDSMKDIYYSEQTAKDKFGVRPNQIADYLALVGDKADNIPGVKGIGPKAAQDLLSKYSSIEDIIVAKDEIEPKYLDKLQKGLSDLEISKSLASLFQLDLNIGNPHIKFTPKFLDELERILNKLEFSDAIINKVKRCVSLYNQ